MIHTRVSFLGSLIVILVLIAAAATFGIVNSQSGNGKYDTDGDGLIEIEYLEQLNAIRYDLDGDGRADTESNADTYAAAFPVSGSDTVCLANCNGYELARRLDFDNPRSYASGLVNTKWTSGVGWLPIGNASYQFNAAFNGNGHTVLNLYIDRTNEFNDPGAVGLFGSARGRIRNIGLDDVDVKGVGYVGGLVGRAERGSTISNSYATGSVSGEGNYVGGLAGSAGSISSSYADSSVSGTGDHVGGLVGQSITIDSSYATGNVLRTPNKKS